MLAEILAHGPSQRCFWPPFRISWLAGLTLVAWIGSWQPGLAWAADPAPTAPAGNLPPLLIGYVPEYRLDALEASQLLPADRLILFSVEPTVQGGLNWKRISAQRMERWRTLRTATRELWSSRNPEPSESPSTPTAAPTAALVAGPRWQLCVGGWERSAAFPAIAASEALRKKFAHQLIKTCKDHDLVGVDLDWEHPKGQQQLAHYELLVETLQREFSPHQLELTTAVATWQPISARASRVLTRVHLMAYDHEGAHSTLPAAISAIDRFVAAGTPAEKLCLGVPLYGRGIKERNRVATYSEIMSRHQPPDDADEVDGLSFNGWTTLAAKADLTRDRRLGGLMVWELGQDLTGSAAVVPRLRDRLQSGDPR